MTLYQLWKKIGKQPLNVSRHKKAIVVVDGYEYVINSASYKDGKWTFMTTTEPEGDPIIHGKWCENSYDGELYYYFCNRCEEPIDLNCNKPEICPNCNAIMDLKQANQSNI